MIDSLLSSKWFERLIEFESLFVAYSGGLDSTVLLHSLSSHPQLRSKITAIHINHTISSNSNAWQVHCQAFCQTHNIPLITRQPDFVRQSNLEEHARNARYQAFASLLPKRAALLLGHHLDDQAETFLLHALRGAGVDGLAAMPDEKEFAQGVLLRPLLEQPRLALEKYALLHRLVWIEDESNQCLDISRNYLRHTIMPLLREKWPSLSVNLARAINNCQQARVNLEDLALMDCPDLKLCKPFLSLVPLKLLSRPRLSNVLRMWLKKNAEQRPSAKIFNQLMDDLVYGNSGTQACVGWGKITFRVYQQTLYLQKKTIASSWCGVKWVDFPNNLCIKGLGELQALQVKKGLKVPQNSLIDVRFRRGGETFAWHGQTKSLKKLLQQWRIPPWMREAIPLIYINDTLVAVADIAISDFFYGEGLAWQIQFVRHCFK